MLKIFSGHACEYILIEKFGLNWSEHVDVLYAGDDLTDEDAFEALAGKAVTCRVMHDQSHPETRAKHRLHSVSEVESLLSAILKESTQGTIRPVK
jgi:trehalose-6-phosphatase